VRVTPLPQLNMDGNGRKKLNAASSEDVSEWNGRRKIKCPFTQQ